MDQTGRRFAIPGRWGALHFREMSISSPGNSLTSVRQTPNSVSLPHTGPAGDAALRSATSYWGTLANKF